MSSPDFLEKLLDGCAVEWKTLGEVARKISSGGTPQTGAREYWDGGTIPWMSSGEVNLGTVHKTENFITEAGLKNSSAKLVPKNSLVIALAGQGKTRGKVARIKIDLTTNQSLASITVDENIVNPDYLYHFLRTQYDNLRKISSGSGNRGGLNLQMISTYKFPLPCPDNQRKSLETQSKIARILDNLTELTTELTTELNAELTTRKKQYNYYRDQSLSFEDGDIEWKSLSEIAYFHNAKPHEKLVSPDGDVALLTAGFISTEGRSARYVKKDDVLTPALKSDVAMVMSDLPNGRALAKTFFVEESGCYAANQRVCLLRVKEPTLLAPKFLHYVMNRNRQLLAYDNGVDQTHLKKDWILSVRIPVPLLVEQNRIVSTLDKFDALTSSLTESLPREIELRQKQYAYYSNLLLSFPKPETLET